MFMYTKDVPQTILGLWLILLLYMMEVPVRIVKSENEKNLSQLIATL